MPSLQVDAILFDMDGTLIDESQSYREAIRMTAEFLLAEPVTPDEVDQIKRVPGFNNDWDATWALVGRRMHGIVAPPSHADRASFAYCRLQNAFQTYYLGDQMWESISGSGPPFSWTEPLITRETPLVTLETMERLAGFELGIATSRPRSEALMALHQHALDRFFDEHAVVAMEDTPFEKPHPAPLLELVQRLGCRIPVYVGDTINDALAARDAGMPFLHVGVEPLNDDSEQCVHARMKSVNEILTICAPALTPQPQSRRPTFVGVKLRSDRPTQRGERGSQPGAEVSPTERAKARQILPSPLRGGGAGGEGPDHA